MNIFEHVGFPPIREQGINQIIKHFILSSVRYHLIRELGIINQAYICILILKMFISLFKKLVKEFGLFEKKKFFVASNVMNENYL